ncbi:MAG TPA: arylsulfatase, partial [Isosphaeraceae bacterium]|nr:arylsulfatase [Isosphaeraceae bacterium]
DRLAKNGLRFTQFYNTGRCWPSRAAFLTGYYAQQVNRDPGKLRPKWAALLPDLLKPAGYRSYHSGKWHVDGPVLEGGFARSYLIDDHNRHFNPQNHSIDDKKLPAATLEDDYYSTRDIAKHAVNWLGEQERNPEKAPFFLYVAFISPHFPIHALPEDIAKYKGRYDEGWDVLRQERWARQKKMGLFDESFSLSIRDPKTIPSWNLEESKLKAQLGAGEVGHAVAWESLNDEEKAFQARKMEIHAGMVDRIDQEVGRVLKKLEAMGELENTIVLFASDNGASAEQIIRGDGHDPSLPPGSAGTFLSLGPGWSTASNTPFRLHKSWNHEGGISTPLIVHWPKGIAAKNEFRHTPGHFVDLAPTLLDLAGLTPPETFDGARRPPFPGRSLVPAFAKDVTIDRDFLFFKHTINRALIKDEWKIVATGNKAPWELYNLANDRGETNNLAETYPE